MAHQGERNLSGLSRHVVVVDAHALGMVAVIRSLGRAGYVVHALSSSQTALGFASVYASTNATHPPYSSQDFLPWLHNYIGEHHIEAIVPSEGFLHAVSDDYEALRELIPDSVPAETWQRCLSKVESHERLCDTQKHLPPAVVLRSKQEISSGIELLAGSSGPYYVKGDHRYALEASGGATVVRCKTIDEVRLRAASLLAQYDAIICQGFAPGKKIGVSLWRHKGEFLAESMCLGIHMSPWHGGMMSYRKSFWHERLLNDAKAKVEALEWEGVAMMEYKWDPTNDFFCFIEINARYWGYLHLDLYSDKDFPKYQLDAFFGDRPHRDLGPAEHPVRCRNTFPGEIGYVASRIKSPELGAGPKLASLLGFFLRFLDPLSKADLLYRGDRRLYFKAMLRSLKRKTSH